MTSQSSGCPVAPACSGEGHTRALPADCIGQREHGGVAVQAVRPVVAARSIRTMRARVPKSGVGRGIVLEHDALQGAGRVGHVGAIQHGGRMGRAMGARARRKHRDHPDESDVRTARDGEEAKPRLVHDGHLEQHARRDRGPRRTAASSHLVGATMGNSLRHATVRIEPIARSIGPIRAKRSTVNGTRKHSIDREKNGIELHLMTKKRKRSIPRESL